MASFQKKVFDYELWIDKARLAWIKATNNKKFIKTHYPSLPKNPSLEQIYQAIKHGNFTHHYGAAFCNLMNTLESLDKDALDQQWPNRPTRSDEQHINSHYREMMEKYGAEKAQRRRLRLGASLKTRKLIWQFILGPTPELDNPIDEMVEVLVKYGAGLAMLTNKPDEIPIEAKLVEYLIGFEQALLYTIATELVLGDTNIFLLDSDTMYNVMATSNDLISLEDMLRLPFDRVYIEFDKPVTLLPGRDGGKVYYDTIIKPGATHWEEPKPITDQPFEMVAMGLYAHKSQQFCSAVFYSDKVGGSYREIIMDPATGIAQYTNQTTKAPVHAPPFLDIIAIHITNHDIQMQLSNETNPVEGYVGYLGPQGISYGDISETYAPLLAIVRNVWRFLTCRNINYDPKRRPHLKPNPAIHGYTHKQGQQANLARDYRQINVDRTVKQPYGTGHKTTELAFRTHMPAVYRRLVYCKTCGDLHRHDLKGTSCRECGKIIGYYQSDRPHINMDIHEIWIPDYWTGPENAPIQQHARHMTTKTLRSNLSDPRIK